MSSAIGDVTARAALSYLIVVTDVTIVTASPTLDPLGRHAVCFDPLLPMEDVCIPHHDWFNALLTFCLCCGLIISYLPQHYRIIHVKSSEGLSPVFLLLGTTSAASALFNMIALQAPMVKCCRVVPFASCVEMTAGIVQLGIQWVCFSIIFILYMTYYPPHLRYVGVSLDELEEQSPGRVKTPVMSSEWRLSIILAWLTVIHLLFISLATAYLLYTVPPTLSGVTPWIVDFWSFLLGISAAMLAAIQYAPQIWHTYRTKLVGALSIPMMMIQTPGGILMATSIILRPGTNWTTWITFAVAAIMQGCLLVMCIFWKIRQNKLHIDDFGNPINSPDLPNLQETTSALSAAHSERSATSEYDAEEEEEVVPGLVTTPSEDPVA
ncbi:hypothetical protein CVT26_001105, partial [Gymnopilus dilepis]